MNRINRYSIQALVKSPRLNGVEELTRGSLNRQQDLTVDEAIRLGHSVEMTQGAKRRFADPERGPYVKHPSATPINGTLLVECWCGKDRLPLATNQVGEQGVSCGRPNCKQGWTLAIPRDELGLPTQCAVCGGPLRHPPRGRPLTYCGPSCRNKAQYDRTIRPVRQAQKKAPEQRSLDERIEQLKREIADLVQEQWSNT